MALLRALRQITGHSTGDLFICDDPVRMAQLMKKVPAIVELVDEATPFVPTPTKAKAAAQPITTEKIKKKK